MRIVIDMQAIQTASRRRGIGFYTLSLVKAMIKNKGDHEIILALSEQFPETIEPICKSFSGLLPAQHIKTWSAPCHQGKKDKLLRENMAEFIYEFFLESLKPDVILISSLFEGLAENAITSINHTRKGVPKALVFYDLIMHIYQEHYLKKHQLKVWYNKKLEHLKKADLLLSISKSSGLEAVNYLNIHQEKIKNISAAAASHFKKIDINSSDKEKLKEKYSLNENFVMYTGGVDFRKNIKGLIRAYANLPAKLREQHQLVIVCNINANDKLDLKAVAKKHKLKPDELIFTGFVPDEDLVMLYNLCKVFVFPSWHEGFGLPVLEAMSCGSAVIAANSTSIPEIIELEKALFKPRDDQAMTEKLLSVLTDDGFRDELKAYSLQRAKHFSWDISAIKAIASLEQVAQAHSKTLDKEPIAKPRKKLAYLSPLPPERSGISDYSADLLPELSKHYDIELVVAQKSVENAWVNSHLKIRNVSWFEENYHLFDRVIYHFGNSAFHAHMFDLLERIPGVVVLHDFFISGLLAHLEAHYKSGKNCWRRALYYSHGYKSLKDLFTAGNNGKIINSYPANFRVLQQACGVITHSHYAMKLAKKFYGDPVLNNWSSIPLLKIEPKLNNKLEARKSLGIPKEAFLICSFGMLSPNKLNDRLLMSFLASSLASDLNVYLIFVGQNAGNIAYIEKLQAKMMTSRSVNNIKITGWTDIKTFHQYLQVADVGVQLRENSRGETSAAVLDCMNYGIPTVVNANGSIAELPKDAVLMLNDDFSDEDLISALEMLRHSNEARLSLASRAKSFVRNQHDPAFCAEQYAKDIERFYIDNPVVSLHALTNMIASKVRKRQDKGVLREVSASLAKNHSMRIQLKQLFIDISMLVRADSKTGIQRVVRSLLKELIDNPPNGYRVEPVYANNYGFGYLYAHDFVSRFLGYPVGILNDCSVDYHQGDIFLGADLSPSIVYDQKDYLQCLHQKGVEIYFIIYDLLPITYPECFTDKVSEAFCKWLKTIAKFDGLLCISKSVAKEFKLWTDKAKVQPALPFKIKTFYLGADIENSMPSKGLPNDEVKLEDSIQSAPSFLMVGTLEPRKMHDQVLSAFELLWDKGSRVNLVIVGKDGWNADVISEKIRCHPKLNKQLFWLEGISDEYLDKIYAASSCLIAASRGEGFGLPLIEAAQNKLPIIARDIPVFKEVTGEHAFYFSGFEPYHLAQAIDNWLLLFESNTQPSSENMPWLTWKESTNQLWDAILTE